MKNILNIRNTIWLFVVTMVLVSCGDDFLDVNDNPNTPSISTPSLTLPLAQHNLSSLNGTSMNFMGNFLVYNWAIPSNWSAWASLLRYNVTTDFFDNIFETSYASVFRDLTYIETYDDGAGDYTAYKAISKILKSYQYQYLVDMYGDVPYTEANMRAENRTPAYDDAEFVYTSILGDLTDAVALIDTMEATAANPGSQDTIFGGDMEKWAQFANIIKLRILMRLSDNSAYSSLVATEIGNIQANGHGYPNANIMNQPGYSDNEDKQNPFWGYIGFQPGSDSEYDRHDYTVATDFTIDYLGFTNDLRVTGLYEEAANGGYHGAYQSTILPAAGFTSEDLSKVGSGLLKSPNQDQPIMLYAEGLLIQAEMVQKGLIPGDAQALYESAIEQSFMYLDIENAVSAAQEYYAQELNNVSWDSSSDKLEAISMQKWIALNGVHGGELWVEYMRTGVPNNLPFPEEVTDGRRVVSLLYPTSEVSRNSENVPPQTKEDAFTNSPFWK